MTLCTFFMFSYSGSVTEPDYVTNLKKFFNDGYNTGTYYKSIASKERKHPESSRGCYSGNQDVSDINVPDKLFGYTRRNWALKTSSLCNSIV